MSSPGEMAGKVVFCLCGPKGSLCCFVLSLWGSLMLVSGSWGHSKGRGGGGEGERRGTSVLFSN